MHLTLSRVMAELPASTIAAQGRRSKKFCTIYNEERPHESLIGADPNLIHIGSCREFPKKLGELESPDSSGLRKVNGKGEFKFKDNSNFRTELLHDGNCLCASYRSAIADPLRTFEAEHIGYGSQEI